MSSLRLALKQSLQEAEPSKASKSSRKGGGEAGKRKKHRSGRKPGRPPKGSPRHGDDADGEQGGSSGEEENEFYEESDEEGEEGEETDGHSHHDDPHGHYHSNNDDDDTGNRHYSRYHDDDDDEHEEGEVVSPPPKEASHSYRDEAGGPSSDDEQRRQHKQLQKKLKHSAAHKIQSQWKKKQQKEGQVEDQGDHHEPVARAPEEDASESHHDDQDEGEEDHDQSVTEEQLQQQQQIKKRKKAKQKDGKAKSKTVSPPSHEVLEWNRCLPIKRARKNVVQGLRVKVRFATKVKRDGKILRKKKWFGGRVSAVSKEGSKIRIKYDDGTAEISKFPDKDVVVDDTDNGVHQANATKFLPRPTEASQPTGGPMASTQQSPVDEPDERKPSLTYAAADTVSHTQPMIEEPARPRTSPVPGPTESASKEVTKAMEVVNESAVAASRQAMEVVGDTRPESKTSPLEMVAAAATAATDMAGAAASSDDVLPPREPSKGSEDPSATQAAPNSKERMVTSDQADEKPHAESQLESPKRSKPTLTIRIPNLKKESSEAKVASMPVAEEESSDDDDESSQNLPTSDPAILNLVERASKKRKADGSDSGSAEEQKRPSKRIYIQTSSFDLGDGKPKAKASPPTGSPDGRETSNPPDAAAVAEHLTPDDGPVKLIGRVSAKRAPLFSDEEEEDAALAASNVVAVSQEVPTEELSHQQQAEDVPTQRPLASKMAAGDSSAFASSEGNAAAFVSSRNSAFEPKESKISDEKTEEELLAAAVLSGVTGVGSSEATGRASTPPADMPSSFVPLPESAASPLIVRSGRKAALEANERIVSTKPDSDKDKSKDPPTVKKRKRRDRDGKSDEESQGSTEDHNNWIQCDRCAKWRIIPNHVTVGSLPKHWFCEDNIYDAKRNSCDAPEQTSQTPVVKKRKRGKKQKVRLRAESEAQPSEEEQGGTGAKKDTADVGPKEKAAGRSRSPLPPPMADTVTKEDQKGDVEPQPKSKRASPNAMPAVEKTPSEEVSEAAPVKKKQSKDKKGASGAPVRKRLPDAPLEETPEPPPKVAMKKRGRKARKELKEKELKEKGKETVERATTASIASTSSSLPKEAEDPDNVEWVQCERCDKWRKLPEHISSDELPDVWYCSMNTWNPNSARCDAPEDKADGQHDVGVFGGSSSAGKLSYRILIFGSGRKVNRAISERTRASESIFGQPSDDAEVGYPTVMYANSSAFAPRGSRHIIEEEDSGLPSVFELMNHSNLWAELRGAALTGFPRQNCQIKTFQTMPGKIKQAMKDILCRILGTNTLTGDEVIAECQHRQFENCPPSWAAARPYCTKDIVITLLCELVKEETVGMVQNRDSEWNPRYFLANIPSHENVAPARATRCMKIAKPWKRAQAIN